MIEDEGVCKGFEIDQHNWTDGSGPKPAEPIEQKLGTTPTTNATTACENPSANGSPIAGDAVVPGEAGQKRVFTETNMNSE